jgi:polar amino acid transport system permease protein
MVMPNMDGLQLVEAMKHDFPLIPVIIMTAVGSEEHAVQALKRGASSYVPKRRLANDLLETVKMVLQAADDDRNVSRLLVHRTQQADFKFTLENELSLLAAAVTYMQQTMRAMGLFDEAERLRIGIALEEVLLNAMFHGNLELSSTLREFPWWLAAIALLGAIAAAAIVAEPLYRQIFRVVANGVWITVVVTVVAFAFACAIGLGLAVMALSRSPLARHSARFYVEIVRGIPMLVLLLYIAFVGAPAVVFAANWLATPIVAAGLIEPFHVRDFPLAWRAVIALTIGYSAFVSEIFRAGIQAVDAGQIEAAKSLGLTGFQRFRLIVMPQAVRVILPPLGNDFVAMVKDSSLVSVLGVADITQLGKIYASGSFRFFETYTIVALVYLALTIGLSLALRRFERGLRRHEEPGDRLADGARRR